MVEQISLTPPERASLIIRGMALSRRTKTDNTESDKRWHEMSDGDLAMVPILESLLSRAEAMERLIDGLNGRLDVVERLSGSRDTP